jgi:hypothetical protein
MTPTSSPTILERRGRNFLLGLVPLSFLGLQVHQHWEQCPPVELFLTFILSLVMVRLRSLRLGLLRFCLSVVEAVAAGRWLVAAGLPENIWPTLLCIYLLVRQRFGLVPVALEGQALGVGTLVWLADWGLFRLSVGVAAQVA